MQIEKERGGLTFAQQMLSKTDFVKHADKIMSDFFSSLLALYSKCFHTFATTYISYQEKNIFAQQL